MKKVKTKKAQKLILGKMTVAEFRHDQMNKLAGGNTSVKPPIGGSKLQNGEDDPDCTTFTVRTAPVLY